MAKYKNYDYSQSLLIPVSLEEQLMPGTLEFAIHILVERRMDMSVFDGKYQNDETGRRAYDPKILLKVVLLAYSRGLTSSRQIPSIPGSRGQQPSTPKNTSNCASSDSIREASSHNGSRSMKARLTPLRAKLPPSSRPCLSARSGAMTRRGKDMISFYWVARTRCKST